MLPTLIALACMSPFLMPISKCQSQGYIKRKRLSAPSVKAEMLALAIASLITLRCSKWSHGWSMCKKKKSP